MSVLSPMHRSLFIDSSRAVDSGLARLPADVWLNIFRHIPSDDRGAVMLRFAGRFPALAFIFEQEPSLWMSWTFCPGPFIEQRPEIRFAMNYWIRLYRAGRHPPIEIRTIMRPTNIDHIVNLIPPQSIPFIRSLYLRVPISSYSLYSFQTFLPELHRLEHLKLIVQCDGILSGAQSRRLLRTLTDHRPVSSQSTALRSLCVNNIGISPDSFSAERWSYITYLHIGLGLRRALPRDISLYDILHSAINISELSVHIAYGLRTDSFSRTFFAWRRGDRYFDWNPKLTFMDIRGAKEYIPAFIISVITHPRAKVDTVHVTYHHATEEQDKLFLELDLFLDVMQYRAPIVQVDTDLFNIVVRAIDGKTSVRNWNMTWKLYDNLRPFWPKGKFLRQTNRFRLLASSIILDSRPLVLEVSVNDSAVALFAMMDEPCPARVLHITGRNQTYEALIHYILEHSDMFPYLKRISFHHHDRYHLEWYRAQLLADIATSFDPPLAQPDADRMITITVEAASSLWDRGKLCIDWILCSPSQSSVSEL